MTNRPTVCKTLVRTSLSSITGPFELIDPPLAPYNVPLWPYASISSEAAAADFTNEAYSADSTLEPPENLTQETVEELLRKKNKVARLMKMERRHDGEVLVDPYIMYVRKEKFRKVVKNRSYGVCLVVKGLGDFGNLSAAFRFADALGFQSVHVVSCDSKMCNDI
ncbi:hypothetical protein C1H46_002465 [Malus baccata]|uniref:tRNA/rRNA methyltransferase SpoU type domain-containing protein n=1 Tax=Malus baccata TaxID=106549 RepID=A0A540NLC0_MALBA|nr:hypothetical protein C1H46_002465 [Malus baccata]